MQKGKDTFYIFVNKNRNTMVYMGRWRYDSTFVTSAIVGSDFSNLSPSPFISGEAAPPLPIILEVG